LGNKNKKINAFRQKAGFARPHQKINKMVPLLFSLVGKRIKNKTTIQRGGFSILVIIVAWRKEKAKSQE